MTEDRTIPDVPAEPQSHQEVYGAYAASDNPNPHLLQHMGRLAADEQQQSLDAVPVPDSPVVQATLGTDTLVGAHSKEQRAQIESTSEDLSDADILREYIDEVRAYDETRLKDLRAYGAEEEIYEILRDGNYTPQELNTFLNDYAPYDYRSSENGTRTFMANNITRMPEALVRDAYWASVDTSTGVAGELQQWLQDPEGNARYIAGLFCRLYGLDDFLSLKDEPGLHLQDPIVRQIVRTRAFAEVAMEEFFDRVNAAPRSKAELSQKKRDWAERFLSAVNLPTDIRDDLLFASHGRISNKSGVVMDSSMSTMLERVVECVSSLGLDKIRLLHDKAGIVNLDYYSVKQLERMTDLLRGDPNLVKHLQAGDVTVVFIDAKGDHNGAFSTKSQLYETPSGRTLFFEVSKRSDFNRYRVMLQRLGVKPSTLVFGAHGSPMEGMGYGGKKKSFNVGVLSANPRDRDLEFARLRALPGLVEEFMQDSRGIDDNEEAIGRRRIILDSCSQAARRVMVPRNSPDGRIAWSAESTAESLVRTAANPKLDVYAGDVPLGVEKTEHGLRMVYFPDPYSNKNAPLAATKLSIDAEGRLHYTRVTVVELRHGAPPEQIVSTRIEDLPYNYEDDPGFYQRP